VRDLGNTSSLVADSSTRPAIPRRRSETASSWTLAGTGESDFKMAPRFRPNSSQQPVLRLTPSGSILVSYGNSIREVSRFCSRSVRTISSVISPGPLSDVPIATGPRLQFHQPGWLSRRRRLGDLRPTAENALSADLSRPDKGVDHARQSNSLRGNNLTIQTGPRRLDGPYGIRLPRRDIRGQHW